MTSTRLSARLRRSLVPGLVALSACGSDDPGTTEPPRPPATPEAQFTAVPDRGLFPLTVTFDASTSAACDGTIVAYDWDVGDGQSSSGRVVDHEFVEAGLYTVSLTVTNEVGDSHTLVA